MAYSYYPATYAPAYQPTPTPTQTQSGNALTWVQGENGAKAYLVAPNTTVLLMDAEGDRFYLKSSDNSGMPLPLRVFEYRETTARADGVAKSAAAEQEHDFVTKREFDALKRAVDDLTKSKKEGIKDE